MPRPLAFRGKVAGPEAASKENHPRMGEIGASTHSGRAAGGQGRGHWAEAFLVALAGA